MPESSLPGRGSPRQGFFVSDHSKVGAIFAFVIRADKKAEHEGRQARRGQRQQHTCGNAPDLATAIGFQTRSEVVKHQTKGLWYIAAFLLYQLKLVFEGSRFAWRVHRFSQIFRLRRKTHNVFGDE